jgi:hypothetical protein
VPSLATLSASILHSLPAMAIEDLWYKNAVLYCLDVEKFMDSNADGIGDFEELSRRLDYLAGLGVSAASACARSLPSSAGATPYGHRWMRVGAIDNALNRTAF